MPIARSCITEVLRLKVSVKYLSQCCPPRPPPGQCGKPQTVSCGKPKEQKPSSCTPAPIPPNPCCPVFHQGHDTYKKYRNIALLMIPFIMVLSFTFLTKPHPHKEPCQDFEYMRRRTKRFPWGSGVESLYHNPHVNHLPGECEPPPLDCD